MVSFSDLGVSRDLVNVLASQGINQPFEVQTESIPDGMLGNDLCCRAPTGSGKTLAFGLPLIERTRPAEPGFPTSLILTPTRELAEQIFQVLDPLSRELGLFTYAVYGGVSYTKQFRALERGVDILVACPGRLIDLLERGSISLEDTDIVVLDEADRMADMGFMQPVCQIIDECRIERQTILFSATLDDEVADLVRDYQTNPVTIEVGPKEVSMESMTHYFWLMPNSKKSTISSEIVRKCGRTIVFCRTRAGADRVGDDLTHDGLAAQVLHGGLSQKQRDRAMGRFQHGECMALIATDVAARGIDVDGVNCVIHYDPPENGKAYKHRSGRTARGGSTGIIISLIQKPQRKTVSKIQREVGINVEFTPPEFSQLPEFEVEFIGAQRRRSFGSRNRNEPNRKHYGNRNRSQPRKPVGGRTSNPKRSDNKKRVYNKKKPRNTHHRPNRGKKPNNNGPKQHGGRNRGGRKGNNRRRNNN
ncbi:MAG: RNA helicase [Euryarchaeota archaeon]|nr:RNA helicase [Euryarchaeota archaeon]